MAQIFRGVLGPFFDEVEAINPSEDFEVFFSAFQAKKPLSLQEIDNELGDILELANIPRGFNEAMFSFLKKNAESTIVVPAITPVVVPAVSAPVVVPAVSAPAITPVVPAAVSAPAITPVVPTASAPAVIIEPTVPVESVTPIEPVTPAITTVVSAPVTVPVTPVTPAITTVVPAAAPVVVSVPVPATIEPAVPVAERKVKLAEVIAFVRKHRTNPEFSALVDFPVTLSNHLLPDNETHEILRQGLNLTEYVGTTVAFQAMIEDIIAKFPDVKNNMTQSAMIQGLISPNEREQVKTLYQGFHIPRPEKKLTKKRKADTQDESGEAAATAPNGKRPYKKRAPAKNIIKNDDRVMATLDMMYRQVGTMYELLGNLLQRGPPVSAPSSQEEMDLDS